MAVTTLANSLATRLNQMDPNKMADFFRIIGLGDMALALPTTKFGLVPAAQSYVLATLQAITLPDDAKAAFIIRCIVRTGAVTGEFTAQAFGATPATTQVAVSPTGDLVFLATDAPTLVDVIYTPQKAKAVEEAVVPVVANVATLNAINSAAGVWDLYEAEGLIGTATGKKIVLVPGAGVPAAGQARLNIAKTTVTFAVADAITSCRLKYGFAKPIDIQTQLEAVAFG